MPSKKPLAVFVTAFSLILGSLAIATPLFAASSEKVLYNFCSANHCTDGSGPLSGLTFDKDGNLYGTTFTGGAGQSCEGGCGTVFELIPSNGKWTEKVLHSFYPNGGGNYPTASPILDSAGNLYGTTPFSGTSGAGVVFELIRDNGKWTEKVLATPGDSGAPLIFDPSGNLYGTLDSPAAAFELIPDNGKWTEKVLYSFTGKHDGYVLNAPMIFDSAGDLYGTTASGGAYGVGTVYELTPGNGKWTEKVLHAFNGKDGAGPWASLVMDKAGHLYGTTAQGGTHMDGVVFEVTP